MKIFSQHKNFEKFKNYIQLNKREDQLFLEYFKSNKDILSEYEKSQNVQLMIFDDSFIKIELFKEDINHYYRKIKKEHLKKFKFSKLGYAEFIADKDNPLNYCMISESLDCCKNWTIQNIIGIKSDTLEFYNNVIICERVPHGTERNKDFREEQKKADNWLNQFLKDNEDSFPVKNMSVSLNDITKEKMEEIFLNCFKGINKTTMNFNSITDKESYSCNIERLNNEIANYFPKNVKENFDPTNYKTPKENFVYIYNYPNIYLNSLGIDILEKNKLGLFSFKVDSMYKRSLILNNVYLKDLLNIDYALILKNDEMTGNLYLCSNGKEILKMEMQDYSIPTKLFSFFENEIKNKINHLIGNKKVLELEKGIRRHITNKEVNIKIDLKEFTLNKVNELSIPIKVLYNDKVLDILYNDNSRNDLNNTINIFVENTSLSEILSKNKIKAKNRL